MCARKVGQFLEPANVLARHDHQTIELGPADHDHVLVDVLGNVSGHISRALVGYPMHNCARVAFPCKPDGLAGKPRQTLPSIHVMAPSTDDFDRLHSG
jgi:hypothetical protein